MCTQEHSDRLAPFRADLDRIAADSRTRQLAPRAGIDFASNDYLALAGHPLLAAAVRRALDQGAAVGATGSRLLRGNTELQEAFESKAAAYFGAESALGFGGGFQANMAALATLPQRGDLLLLDALSHASSLDGARLSRADVAQFRHNDPQHANDMIAQWRQSGGKGAVWLGVESLYSMDGDRAPLDDLAFLAGREGFLIVDEAHATGVWGPGGRGLAAGLEGRDNVITLHTLGKALGGQGALLCLPDVLRRFLINRARPFIFATAPSPLMAAAGSAALDLLRDEPERQRHLHDLIVVFEREISRRLPQLSLSGSQIAPLLVGPEAETMALAARVQAAGFDVRGIRPPTVPAGTSRLRVALTLNATSADVTRLVETLEAEWPVL